MTTIEEIRAKLTHIEGFSKLGSNKEIKALPEIIAPGETFLLLVPGSYRDRLGILALTDQRLIFVRRGLLWGGQTSDFPLRGVSSITYETGLVFGKIKIVASGASETIAQIEKRFIPGMVEAIQSAVGRLHIAKAPPASSGEDLTFKLSKLAALKADGALSDEEFSAAKARLLEG